MAIVLSVLTLAVCILLMIVVLVQNSKGGGLSSSFGMGNQLMGVRKTTDFLEKATWTLSITLFALCILSASVNSGGSHQEAAPDSEIKELVEQEPIVAPQGFGTVQQPKQTQGNNQEQQ